MPQTAVTTCLPSSVPLTKVMPLMVSVVVSVIKERRDSISTFIAAIIPIMLFYSLYWKVTGRASSSER